MAGSLSYGGGQVGQADTSYWAGFDKKSLVDRLQRKREEFLEFFDRSNYFQRIYRNWAYYHGLNFDRGYNNTEIRVGGEEGELRLVQVNEFRSNLQLLKTYITEGDIEWDAIATGDTGAALNAAKKCNKLLDGAVQSRTLGIDQALDQAIEDSLVMTAGYAWNLWDKHYGEPAGVDASGKGLRWKGEVRVITPALFDVTFDFTKRVFKESQWVEVRRQENRWDLAAEYSHKPRLKEEILKVENDHLDRKYLKFDFRVASEEVTTRDHRWVHYFYHEPCPSLPNGRFIRRINQVVLEDEMNLPDGHIPVLRVIPAQFLLTPFGFTNAFSAQAPQEALNATESTIVTNQNALGPTKLWHKKGEPLNRAQLEPGITVLECETKPEPINFCHTPKEFFDSLKLYMDQIERAFGTNETARGNPESNIKAAAALAFTEQRVTQAASDLVKNRRRFLMDYGTSLVKVYAARLGAGESRMIDVRSTSMSRSHNVRFTPEELAEIKTVSIIPGNPAMRTLGGRIQVAEILLEKQAVSPDEFVTVLKTGKLDKLTESEDNQLQLIAEENDDLFAGEGGHTAYPHHNHMLHIRRHLAQADSDAGRRFPEIAQRFQAAALMHKDFLTFVSAEPVVDPETGMEDIEATQDLLLRAEVVKQSIEYNKMLGYLPPTFIPFGAPPPPPGMEVPGMAPPGAPPLAAPPPVEPLQTTAMGTPPDAALPTPESPPTPSAAPGGGPRLTGVADSVMAKIGAGEAA